MGGPVTSVSNVASLMIYQKNQGVNYLIIKAGDGAIKFPNDASPQLTSEVVNAAHAAGVKIFGYCRSFGTNVPGELAIADYVFNQGADGFVIDAESEWESVNLANNTTVATNFCGSLRAAWPNKFIAHAPSAYISGHSTFPYKEFGYYCDVAMPQDYWIEFGENVTNSAQKMNSDWLNWQNGLTEKWTNSIKPIVPVGQGWSSGNGTIDAAQITGFVETLKTMASPAGTGGYKGVNYFRAELHPLDVLSAIRTNTIGNPATNAPIISNVNVGTVSDISATITFTTDQSSDSAIEFGLTASYGAGVTNATALYYHSVTITGLSPNTTYHYRARATAAGNPSGVSSDYVFTTLAAPVPDIIVDDANVAYLGAWTVGASAGYSGTEYRFASSAAGGTSSATFRPTINVAGNYDIYVWYIAGSNRATNSPYTISYNGGTNIISVDQTANGGTWRLLASAKNFATGTNGYVRLSNDVGYSGKVVISDAVKFVYVPPPPSGPSIGTQPGDQAVNQGGTFTFSVVAAGTSPLSYQWMHEGTNLAGATLSSYQKVNAQVVDAGLYSVRVTNSVSSITSSNAMLTVNVPPSISTQPSNVTANAGGLVTFAVVASGTAPIYYQWRFQGGDISGATDNTYSRTNVQAADSGAYSVIVSNVAGSAQSDDAMLTVNSGIAPPHIDGISLLGAGNARLDMSGGPGRFAVEASAVLTNWSELGVITAAGALFQFTDTETNAAVRFYRLRVVP